MPPAAAALDASQASADGLFHGSNTGNGSNGALLLPALFYVPAVRGLALLGTIGWPLVVVCWQADCASVQPEGTAPLAMPLPQPWHIALTSPGQQVPPPTGMATAAMATAA